MADPIFIVNSDANRFELHIAEHLAEINYRRDGDTLYLDRVFTPEELRGQGVAGRLTKASLEWVQANGLNIVPICPYVTSYIERHPEWESLIKGFAGEKKYSFMDDYSEGCHPNILKALSDNNFSQQNAYGNDEFSQEARRLIQAECQSDPEIFFVAGGTLANIIIHSAVLRSHEAVITAYNGHINRHETGAIEATGHKVITVPSDNGKLSIDHVQTALNDYALAPHMVIPKMVYISNATEMGTVYTRSELESLSAFCRQHDLYLLVDGARLGSALASVKSDLTLADFAKLSDIFWLGGTKMGALLGEAIVINNPKLAEDFAFHVKQRGALTAKGRVLGIQFRELFKNRLYYELAETTNQHAKQLADGITAKGYKLASDLESNQVFPILPNTVIKDLEKQFKFYVWKEHDAVSSVIRLVTSWATDEKLITEFIGHL